MSHTFTRSDTISSMLNKHHRLPSCNENDTLFGYQLLGVHFEAALTNARPRLLRFAQGLSAEAADDIVQETLLEAWRHLDRAYTPQGIDT